MPQSPSNPPQTPGEDVLLDTLRRSKISDDQRQQIWDVYHTQGDEKAFTGALNKTAFPDDIKQTLYDIRFKGFKNLGNQQATPEDISNKFGIGSYQMSKGAPVIDPEAEEEKIYTAIAARKQLKREINNPPGSYQSRKGGPILNVNQSIPNAFIQGIESAFGIKPPSDVLPHPYLAAFAQAMRGGAKLLEQTAKDPITPFDALARGVENAASDIESGVRHRDPREIASALGAITGLRGLREAGEKTASKAIETVEGPIEGGINFRYTPEVARSLQKMGFSNQDISSMNATDMQSALAGKLRPSPTPEAPKPARTMPGGEELPTRKTEAVQGKAQGAEASVPSARYATSQTMSTVIPRAAEPKTTTGPLGDYRGMSAPMRPWDPQGTRFAKGGTIGMEPVNTSQVVLKDRDPITGAIVQPTVPGKPTIKGPLVNVKGMPDPLQMALENANLLAKRPASPYAPIEPYSPVNPAEIVDLQRELAAQGYKGEVNEQNIHQLLRRANDIRAVIAPRPDDVAAIREAHRATLEQPGRPEPPINRGSEAGIAKADDYYKPSPGELIPSSEAEVPKPQAITPPVKAEVPASHELPNNVQDGLDLMMRVKKLVDEAPTDEARQAAQARWQEVSAFTKKALKEHLATLTPEQHKLLLDDQLAKAERTQKQSQAINDIITGDNLAKALREEMRGPKEGQGEIVGRIGTKPQFSKTTGGPIRVVGTLHGDLRAVIHEMLGDKTSMQFDEIALNQRARAREMGLDPDAVQPEGYRRVAPEEFSQMRLEAKQELKELQDNFKTRLKNIVEDRIEKNPALIQEQGEEAAKNIHAQALKELLAEKNANGQTLHEQINDLRALIGRDPQRPLYTKKGEPIIEAGVIKAPGDIPAKSLEVARRIWDKPLNKIPSEAEWQKKASEFQERSRLHRAIAQGVKAFLDIKPPKASSGQSGFIGEQPAQRAEIKVPDTQQVISNAKKAGLTTWTMTDDKPAGARGWISPDGKTFIGTDLRGDMSDHDSVAWVASGKQAIVEPGKSQEAFMYKGWIRKEVNVAYSIAGLSNTALNTIEMDLIRTHSTNQPVILDILSKEGIRSVDLQPGWDNLKEAVRNELFRQRRYELGASGTTLTTGMAIGGVVGTVAGHVLGGHAMIGGTIGMSLGFMAPAILQSRAVGQAMRAIAGTVRNAGISLKTWFQGIPQQSLSGLDPDMDNILHDQQVHADRSVKWIERAKQLPAQIYKGVDPFAYVADKRNMGMIGRVLMSFDPQGRIFRDLTIPDNQSLYMALANAGGDALGQRRYQNTAYNEIKVDANKLGLREILDRYLNYKAYQRTNEVLQEHIQTLDNQIQDLQGKLQNPSNTVRQNIALQDDLKDTQKMRKEIDDKVQQGLATPGGYTIPKIQAALAKMQQQIGAQKFAQVEQLAQRAFQARKHILDMLFDSGIISQDAYTTYTSRGIEYVPMERIMDDLENSRFSSSTNPLHLRHQTVIQQLEGSTRTNVNPWEAFDHADRKAFSQLYRNDAMKSALDLAGAYPNTVGQEFVPVKQGYVPEAGEMILGHYQNGQPNLYAVPKYLGETMQLAPLATKTSLSVFANWYGHMYKKAATVGSVGFQVSSALAHALSGMILAPHGAAPLPSEVIKFANDWRKAAKEVLNNGQFVRELTRYGGASGQFQSTIDPEYYANPSELGFKGKLAKGQLIDAAQDFALAIENINRTNIYMRARQAGATQRAAAWEAKQFAGMPDFSRLGDISRPLNHILMFYNAANQYMAQVSAAIRKNPARVFMWAATLTAMSIANSAWNMQQVDTKGNNLLRKETVFDRQRNWIVELPWTYYTHAGAEKGYTVKLPKPYIARLLNPAEDIINYAIGKESRTGQQQALDSIANISPIHLNLKANDLTKSVIQSGVSALHPLAKFGIQQYSNLDDYGRPIVPGSQQGIAPEFQQGPYTSAVAQRMGQGGVRGAIAGGALGTSLGMMTGYPGAVIGGVAGAGLGASGISPRRIDVGVRSLTAGIGSQTESFLDPFFGGAESQRTLQGPEYARNLPVVGQIVGRFVTSPSDAEFESLSEQFYTSLQQADTIMKTSDYLLSQGRGQEAAQFVKAHEDEIHKAAVLNSLLKPITELNQQIRMIQGSAEASTEAGRKALESVYEVRMRFLRAAKNLLEAAPSKASDTGPMGNVISNTSPSK